MKYLLLLAILLLCIPAISAKTYHMTLLTVGETGEETIGGTADAYLDIKPGSGRIFLDSFPLTKIDTQISTRYANRVACDYLEVDCRDMDFFYTIRADSTIVGGPSASAPLTVLTIAALKGIELRNDTVMTGTINSGGSIGPVGGVPKKAKAAQDQGFVKVLVPLFSIELEELPSNLTTEPFNITINRNGTNLTRQIEINNITEQNLTIEIIKIRNIDEAIYHFTGRSLAKEYNDPVLPQDYIATMKGISEGLCSRTLNISARLNSTETNRSNELRSKIASGLEDGSYYSAASYCFNLGVTLRRAKFKEISSKSPERLEIIQDVALQAAREFESNLEKKNLTTISELETYIIVKERLEEAIATLTDEDATSDELAYAIERYYSGVEWSKFFNIQGKELELNTQYLEEACYKKISEAEERINYASIYLPPLTSDARESIEDAYQYASRGNHKMCLFKASFGKAESNLLLSSISVGQDQVEELAEEKIRAASRVIAKEQADGIFPILGYSYFEYADNLRKNGDNLSSLIFSEYSLELSNIQMYFPEKDSFSIPRIDPALVAFGTSAFSLGLASGIVLTAILVTRKKPRRKR